MDKIIKCPICNEVTIKDPVDGDHWKCPKCGTEIWPDISKLSLIKAEAAAKMAREKLREQLRWSISKRYTEVLPPVPVINPGSRGSRSSGRKRKKPRPHTALITERYMIN